MEDRRPANRWLLAAVAIVLASLLVGLALRTWGTAKGSNQEPTTRDEGQEPDVTQRGDMTIPENVVVSPRAEAEPEVGSDEWALRLLEASTVKKDAPPNPLHADVTLVLTPRTGAVKLERALYEGKELTIQHLSNRSAPRTAPFDAAGRAKFTNLAPGRWAPATGSRRSPIHPLWINSHSDFEVAEREAIEVPLPVEQGYTLRGKVVNEEGRRMSNVHVSVGNLQSLANENRNEIFTAETDEAGLFEISTLPEHIEHIDVFAGGYRRLRFSGVEAAQKLVGPSPAIFEMQRGGRIVVDLRLPNGRPAIGISAWLLPLDGQEGAGGRRSRERGRVSFASLDDGRFELRVAGPLVDLKQPRADVRAELERTDLDREDLWIVPSGMILHPTPDPTPVEVTLTHPARVTCQVIGLTLRPGDETWVELKSLSSLSGAYGSMFSGTGNERPTIDAKSMRFSSLLMPGPYSVSVMAGTKIDFARSTVVRFDVGVDDLDIQVPMQGRASIGGCVALAGSGEPVEGATVSMVVPSGPGSETKAVISDANGRFEIDALPAGVYTIEVETQAGYVEAKRGVALLDGEKRDQLDFTVVDGGWIDVQLTQDDSATLDELTATAFSADDSRAIPVASTKIERDGRGRLGPLPEGATIVRVVRLARGRQFAELASLQVQVSPSGTVLASMSLPATNVATLTGSVVSAATGVPIGGQSVLIQSHGRILTTARTDSCGAFSAECNLVGRVQLALSRQGAAIDINLQPGENTLEPWAIPTGIVRGKLDQELTPPYSNGLSISAYANESPEEAQPVATGYLSGDRFEVSSLPTGTYRLVATSVYTGQIVDVVEPRIVHVKDGVIQSNVLLRVRRD